MQSLFMPLLAAHLAGDFVLQNDRDAARKHSAWVLLRHIAVHAVLLGLVGWWRGPLDRFVWGAFAGLLVSHALIDAITSRIPVQGARRLIIDQMAHVVALISVVQWVAPDELQTKWAGMQQTLALRECWTMVVGGLVAIWVGGIVVGIMVRPFAERLGKNHVRNEGLESAGRLIGKCERALIFLFILMHSDALIGFVVAAKALMRLPEARDAETKGAAEYYLVGTFLSVAWAVITGYGVRWLLG
jgi:hypothetical protein